MTNEQFEHLQQVIAHIDKTINGLKRIIEDTSSYYCHDTLGEKRILIRKETIFVFGWEFYSRSRTTPMPDDVAILLNGVCKEKLESLEKHKAELLEKLNKP